MRKHALRLIPALLCLLLCSCSIGGKDVHLVSDKSEEKIFEMGELTCVKSEFLVYLANYKNLYGVLFGTNIWENGKNLEELKVSLKDAAFSEVTKIYALNIYANANEVALTEGEIGLCDQAAADYFDSLQEEEKEYFGIKPDAISVMYQRYALAQKAYASLVRKVDPEVSDDDARVMDVIVIYTPSEREAKEALLKIKDGMDFETAAENYSKKPNITASIGRGELDAEVEKEVFALGNNQYTDVVEDDGGYYIYYCDNKYNEKLSEDRKTQIYEQRKQSVMDTVYSVAEGNGTSYFDSDVFDSIEVNTEDYIATDSYFSTLEKYLNFSW